MFRCLHTHASQLGSEAMVSPPPVGPPRGCEVASSAVITAESPRWPSHRAAESVSKIEGAQEAGWLNVVHRSKSDAGWRMTLPPWRRYWKLNLICFLCVVGSMCAPLWLMLTGFGRARCCQMPAGTGWRSQLRIIRTALGYLPRALRPRGHWAANTDLDWSWVL